MVKKRVEVRRCPVDGRFFSVNSKQHNYHHHHGPRGHYCRPTTAKTCSPTCSKLYTRNKKKYLKNMISLI